MLSKLPKIIITTLTISLCLLVLNYWMKKYSIRNTSLKKVCRWDVLINSNMPGGMVIEKRQTLKSCMKLCIDEKECIGFDYASESDKLKNCWIHFTNHSFPIIKNEAVGVVHHKKICSKKFSMYKPIYRDCVWKVLRNKIRPDSLLLHDVISLEACKQACLLATNCAGVNWNENEIQINEKCSLTTNKPVLSSMNGNDYHVKKCNDDTKNFQIVTSECSWQKYENRSSITSIPQPRFKNFKKCLKKCHKNQWCNSFNWNQVGKECSFGVSEKISIMNGVDYYTFNCETIFF